MITPITFASGIKPTTIHNKHACSPLYNKSGVDSVSFTSSNILTKPSKEITKTVLSALENKMNFIGEGTEGCVYKIPDSDYCVKVFKNEDYSFGYWSVNLHPSERVNHILARAENNAVIMKYIQGIPMDRFKRDVSDIPTNSIKQLLTQIVHANEEAMLFDSAPSNVIYNPRDKSLTAIDFYADYEREYSEARPLSKIFGSLSVKDDSEEAKSINRKLGGKILNIIIDDIATQKEPQFPMDKGDINHLLNKIRFSQNFDTPPQFECLVRSLNNIVDMKSNKIPETGKGKNLEGEIKFSKCIIKQCLEQ